MATNINTAFRDFMRDVVNLDPNDTDTARGSRDWLLDQIHFLPSKVAGFPPLYTDVDIHYGSFARRTKIRPLNDLDMIVGISALGTTYLDLGGTVYMTVPEGIALRQLCHDDTNTLNSRRVINKFVKHLNEISQYEDAVERNQSAAVLRLKTRDWNFDIVPGFFTKPEYDGRTYYLIPDANGHWMKTDPRIDQKQISTINQAHDRNVLNAVRLMKYWNRHASIRTIQPYLLETIVLNYYDNVRTTTASSYVDMEFRSLLDHIAQAIYSGVQDPKGIQGDLNKLTWDERFDISSKAREHMGIAARARQAETDGDHETSIKLAGQILRSKFPAYG